MGLSNFFDVGSGDTLSTDQYTGIPSQPLGAVDASAAADINFGTPPADPTATMGWFNSLTSGIGSLAHTAVGVLNNLKYGNLDALANYYATVANATRSPFVPNPATGQTTYLGEPLGAGLGGLFAGSGGLIIIALIAFLLLRRK